jgi:hypothetical protein
MSSISTELWDDVNGSCGIGTIIHEFAHCLGLPDLYPTSNAGFSVVDDWDLMDGGNYINWGWCPPNFSVLEKMLLGWDTPVELNEATTVTGMKPVSEGGTAYLVRNSGIPDEYYILENRCQSGWDYGVPGNGLLIFHVDYDPIAWEDNVVNTQKDHFRYDLFHPDGKNYKDWDPAQNGKDMSKYTMDKRLRSIYLSTTTYPYVNPETGVLIHSLTDDTTPAATLFNANAAFEYKMSKPITNIQLADDGTVSFSFMGDGTAVKGVTTAKTGEAAVWYDLNGGRLSASPSRAGIFIRRNPDGTSRKVVIHK